MVDGGSQDGSVEYLESLTFSNAQWISEPDDGIYAAMNKGIALAQGEYILFLNSGDSLSNKRVLEQVFTNQCKEDLLYGNTQYTDGHRIVGQYNPPVELTVDTLVENTLNHQSVFFHRRIFEHGCYDVKYRFLADWVLYFRTILFRGGTYRYLGFYIADYDVHGTSSLSVNQAKLSAERLQFYQEHAEFFLPYFYDKYMQQHTVYNQVTQSRILKFIYQGYLQLRGWLGRK